MGGAGVRWGWAGRGGQMGARVGWCSVTARRRHRPSANPCTCPGAQPPAAPLPRPLTSTSMSRDSTAAASEGSCGRNTTLPRVTGSMKGATSLYSCMNTEGALCR